MKDFEELLDVPFTFSKNCRSGLLAKCECWRCKQSRGEEVTADSESLAEIQAKQADEEFAAKNKRFFEENSY
jgi:hypothetical protein